MKFAPKPTLYRDVTFRSRLEARWAAFFDLAGWAWDYEPYDLDGWVPDFALRGACVSLIEVKPIEWTTDPELELARFSDDLAKVYRNAPTSTEWGEATTPEVIVLGASPLRLPYAEDRGLGMLVTKDDGAPTMDVALLHAGIGRRLDFCAEHGWFGYRMGGQADGNHHLIPLEGRAVDKLWFMAGDMTRWKKPEHVVNGDAMMPASTAMARALREIGGGE